MINDKEKNYQEWFGKANEDELSIKAILKNEGGAPSTVCFLSQQMAEKYLKGLLIFHSKEFPKIHDLLRLEGLILKYERGIKNYEKDLDSLSTYYFETRYIGDYPEFTWKDAREAYKAAVKIKEFVLDRLRQGLRKNKRIR